MSQVLMGEYRLCVAEENSPIYNSEPCQGVRDQDTEVYHEGFASVSKKNYQKLC
ncbi:MAG: hypothetical protein F6K16_07505 [Symploca sp. SIO2B6]|nr:hypothetical protein [Symploca sp. SIO2B6]